MPRWFLSTTVFRDSGDLRDHSELWVPGRALSESSELITHYPDEDQVENSLLDLGPTVRTLVSPSHSTPAASCPRCGFGSDLSTGGGVVREKGLVEAGEPGSGLTRLPIRLLFAFGQVTTPLCIIFLTAKWKNWP